VPLHIQADDAHQGDGITLGDDAVAQLIVEAHFVAFDLVFEVNISDYVSNFGGDFCEREVVGRDDTDRAALEQALNEALGANAAVFGVCAFEEFIEEEE
jgi:hypothetical protein